jgi:fatty acyl-CoA reductase
VVPVDRVARGLIVALAAALEDRCPAVIQLGSSDVNPLRFDRAVELTALGLRRHHSLAGNEPWRRVGVELEAYPVGWKAQPWWQSGGLKGLIGFAADKLPGGAGLAAHQLGKGLGKLEKVLAMFKPFVHDHDWGFRTDNIRRLDGLLSAEEREIFGWDVPTLDWRRYWVDVQVPGLVKWCFPVLEGREVPQDMQRHALPAIAVRSRSTPDPVAVEVHAA